MNYNDVLKYIIDNLSDYREEIDSTLNYMYKYRLPFSQADRGSKLEDTIMSAISDYEVDNDYEHDEILDQLLNEYDLEDIFFNAIDRMDNRNNESIDEAYETHDWKHFDNDDRRYEAYVLIDESDGSIIYNYQVWPGDYWLDILNDAIEDAREEQRHNKYGSYGVYGCINNEYDESTRVFITNGLNESNKINEAVFNKHKRNVYDDTKDPNEYGTQPLKDNVSLYDIRQRVEEILFNCNENDYKIAKKQIRRLYKFVDTMINQGFQIN